MEGTCRLITKVLRHSYNNIIKEYMEGDGTVDLRSIYKLVGDRLQGTTKMELHGVNLTLVKKLWDFELVENKQIF